MSEDNPSDLRKELEKVKGEELLRQQIAEARKGVAEAEQAIAEAEKAKFEARIPTGTSKPVEGAITTDAESGYMAEVSAYDAMAKLADSIAVKITSKIPATLSGAGGMDAEAKKPGVLIVDSLDFVAEDTLLLQITEQLRFWFEELHAQRQALNVLLGVDPDAAADPIALLAFLPLVSGILASTADVVGFFKTDYDIKGRKVEKSDAALRLRVASRIDRPVYFPNFHRMKSSTIITDFRNCIVRRKALVQSLAELKSELIDKLPAEINALKQESQELEAKIAKLNSPGDDGKIAKLKTELKTKKELLDKKEATKGQADATYTRSEALLKAFDEFNKELTSVPEGKDYSPLARAAHRQYLDELGITHLLYLTITSIGGEVIAGKGLFRSGNIAFLGGCIVSYALANDTGAIIASDTIAGSSYVKFKLGQDKPPDFRS